MTAGNKKQEPIIQVKNISKQYHIGMDRTYKTFAESFTNAVKSPIKSLKHIGHQNDTFWALKDINFEVERGEVVGIIGRNGAGKSTLLKILSRITSPTEGEIRLKGRVGSLLEVGTGFHPELTGRENIYFNGAILGMKKKEIDDKFDEIVKFSGVEKFLDTPVKRYSSGMQVRLAFSVAANLDPEILVVDEVLAVGDAQFQKKCLGKMGEVAEGGRTVLFVSHNMGAISSLCERVIHLKEGLLFDDGPACNVVQNYMEMNTLSCQYFSQPPNHSIPICLIEASVCSDYNNAINSFSRNRPIDVKLKYRVNNKVDSVHVYASVINSEGSIVLGTGDADLRIERFGERNPGTYTCKFTIPGGILNEGLYSISVSLGKPFIINYQENNQIINFNITEIRDEMKYIHHKRPGIIKLDLNWEYFEKEPVIDRQFF